MENQETGEPNVAQKVALSKIISPASDTPEEFYNQASIIKGLSVNNQLEKVELRAYGYRYSALTRNWVLATEPLMNDLGINKLLLVLEGIGDLASFSNLDDKKINKLADYYFTKLYVEFVIYEEVFELPPYRRGELATLILSTIYSILNNSKGAGHRNTIRGVLSESVMAQALEGANKKPEKKGLFKLNPFAKN